MVRAAFQRRHYLALWNLAWGTPSPARFLADYLTGLGSYPRRVTVRTPTGERRPLLNGHHDLLTVNEIFFRRDYASRRELRVVVDVGSNIGISALFFLSEYPACRCYLFEPVPSNVARLRENLTGFEQRFVLEEAAVADASGEIEFGVEPTGRYGGIGVPTGQTIRVACRHINDVLDEVLAREGYMDVLKLDTEGAEERTVNAIAERHLARIGQIFVEGKLDSPQLLARFDRVQYGPIARLANRDPDYRTRAAI